MVTTVAIVGLITVFLALALTAYTVYLTEGRGVPFRRRRRS
jgi:hypothetical protein